MCAFVPLCRCCRQVEALRMLYNEELGRASRLAVELSKATAALDKVSDIPYATCDIWLSDATEVP